MPLPSLFSVAKPRAASGAGERFSRRSFEAIAIAGAAGMALPQPSAADAAVDAGWIDAHVHVWTDDTERYPLAPGYHLGDMQPTSFTPEELFAHCAPVGVNRVVLIQMSFYGFDNRYMLDMIAAHPGKFSGVAVIDTDAANAAEQIQELAKQGVRGLRLNPGPNEAVRWVNDANMKRVWAAAREQGIALCLLINPSDLPHVDSMCAKFPGARVVIDHFARVGMSGQIDPAALRRLVGLARFPGVHVKTSAFYALGAKRPPYEDLLPMIRALLDAYGPERLMWASDCPFQVQGQHTYVDSIALIRDRASFLSDSDKQSLLRTTAENVFFANR